MKKVLSVLCLIMVFTVSCDKKSNEKEVTAKEISNTSNIVTLAGKKAKLIYPEFEAEVSYISENELHWKTVDSSGKILEGDEKISSKKIGNSLFFINWIEKDGITVSQVIDVDKKSVVVYMSYQDEKSSRGNRSADFIEGKWEEIK
ncbi:MoaF-related domain-containing protein [Flavobacterium notoginsengisoli]|uniref:MoaF-related domain-containing protein n=1 Tax=Flavobacterium notoginsengisoli TaxID=1478199 RepID=UPI003637786F